MKVYIPNTIPGMQRVWFESLVNYLCNKFDLSQEEIAIRLKNDQWRDSALDSWYAEYNMATQQSLDWD